MPGSQHLGDIGTIGTIEKVTSLEEITKTEGNVGAIGVSDGNLQQLMCAVLKEVKIMNFHLSAMTDLRITELEVE